MDFLIPMAHAADAPAGPSPLANIGMLVVFIAIFYFCCGAPAKACQRAPRIGCRAGQGR